MFNQAIATRYKAIGMRPVAPICPCGSFYGHHEIDGPDPMQELCDGCGATVSRPRVSLEQIDAVLSGKLQGSPSPP